MRSVGPKKKHKPKVVQSLSLSPSPTVRYPCIRLPRSMNGPEQEWKLAFGIEPAM